MASAIEEILRKLVSMERRIARLEEVLKLPPLPASGESGSRTALAPGASAYPAAGVAGGAAQAGIAEPPPPGAPTAAAARPAQLALVGGQAMALAVASVDAPTVRLARLAVEDPTPMPAIEQPIPEPALTPRPGTEDASLAFPDLSELDAKLEIKRGPPEKLDVKACLEDFPRICGRIQELWQSPECEAYLTNLIIDTRGNRQGFPPGVMDELLYLARLARALVIMKIGGDLWDAYDQVGDRR